MIRNPARAMVERQCEAAFRMQGWSYRKIGRALDIDHKTAKNHLTVFEGFLRGIDPPVVKSNDTDPHALAKHFIIYRLSVDTNRSTRTIADMMREMPFAVQKSEVSKLIHQMNLTCRETTKRPRLTEKQLRGRMAFATGMPGDIRWHLPWLFTDESLINLNPTRRTCYAIPGLTTVEGTFQDYQKFPVRVMVWGGIAFGYKSPLIRIDGIENAEKYINMLTESQMIPILNSLYGEMGWVFQDDGASPHRAKITKKWFANSCLNVANGGLPWPANSPDLNPIEQMWAILKRAISREGCTTPEELFRRAEAAWNAISQDSIDAMVQSYQTRIQAVLALQGRSLNGHRDILTEPRRKTNR
jgi:hypothetical protein